MNPPDKTALLAAFGLPPDATDQALLDAMAAYASTLTPAPDGQMTMTPEDVQTAQAMKSMITGADVDEDDLDFEIVRSTIQSIIDRMTPRRINVQAMKSVFADMQDDLLNAPPLPANLPAAGRGASSSSAAKSMPSKKPTSVSNSRSSNLNGFNINHNTPYTPLTDMFSQIGLGRKALSYEQSPLGGLFLQSHVYSEIIEALEGKSVLANLGIETIPGAADGQPVEVIRNTATTTVQNVAVNGQGSDSDLQFDTVKITPVILQAEIYVPKVLLNLPNQSSAAKIALDRFIRNDLVKQIARKQMQQAFYGTGVASAANPGREVYGLKNMDTDTRPVVQYEINEATGNGGAPSEDDVLEMAAAIRSSNIEPEQVRMVLSTRTSDWFLRMRNFVGDRSSFVEPRDGGANINILHVEGWASNIVSDTNTVGDSDDCSDIFVGDFSKSIMTEGTGISIELMTDSVFQRKRQVGFLASLHFGFKPYLPEAFKVITGVRAVRVVT